LEGLATEDVGLFYGHLVYVVTIWYILWAFGTSLGHLVYVSSFGMLHQEKSCNPASNSKKFAQSGHPGSSCLFRRAG
jgi:hypothetical protein